MSVATLFQPVRIADDRMSELLRLQFQYIQDPNFFRKHARADYDKLKELGSVLLKLPVQDEPESVKLAADADQPPRLEWQTKDNYPPHAPSLSGRDAHDREELFIPLRLSQMFAILQTPDAELSKSLLAPSRDAIKTLEQLTLWYQEQYSTQHPRHPRTPVVENLYSAPNIGLRNDWYTDAVFAQQFFTGTSPNSITLASSKWISQFSSATNVPSGHSELLKSDSSSFYIVDYSYIRDSMGVSPGETLVNDAAGVNHYGCSPIALFHLNESGELHPVAITIDYKAGIISESVTIYNQRLDSSDATHDQSQDWPWRYAKMCVLSADWAIHEMIVHLTQTHLVEEALIVAARRAFYNDLNHIVYRLLSPHWNMTLALNLLARSLLVLRIIASLAGFSGLHTNKFFRTKFTNFDWKGKHIPNDLEHRGFPIDQLGSEKFHNYTYAWDIIEMW
ncbi:hypothetical protein ONZ45_g12930 [Pleurotus djamor]|nr:hypothetical protein ONZ45_g12930 [Pleurotus djamor]